MIKNILVPFDFSKNAMVALRYAARVARVSNAHIYVQHVLTPKHKDLYNTVLQKKNMDEMVSEELSGLSFFTDVSEGVHFLDICKLPSMDKADIIIMGTKGCKNLRERLVGSHTYQLIEKTRKPVFVIPGESTFEGVRNIMFCSDFEAIERGRNMELLKGLAILFKSNMRIVHVKTHSGEPSFEHFLESKTEKRFFEPEVNLKFKIIYHDNALDGINYYIRRKSDNDLIVLIKRKHSLYEKLFRTNHTKNMVFHSNIPLLILNDITEE
jgi:nucleotide-binding universal stress UspA family protein